MADKTYSIICGNFEKIQFFHSSFWMANVLLTLKKNVFPMHCGTQLEVGTNRTASKLPSSPRYVLY